MLFIFSFNNFLSYLFFSVLAILIFITKLTNNLHFLRNLDTISTWFTHVLTTSTTNHEKFNFYELIDTISTQFTYVLTKFHKNTWKVQFLYDVFNNIIIKGNPNG